LSGPVIASPVSVIVVSGYSPGSVPHWGLWGYQGNLLGSITTNSISVPPMMDASSALYLVIDGAALRVVQGDGVSGFGSVLLNIPAFGAPITSSIIGRAVDSASAGTLYLTAGSQAFAYTIDTQAGLATMAGESNGTSWPAANRDACASSNLAYACPY
jgi:hypothetical protein